MAGVSVAAWSSLVHNVRITPEEVHRAYEGWTSTYEQDLANLGSSGEGGIVCHVYMFRLPM